MSASKTEEFIQCLEKTGLTYDEALVYYTLIQHGKKGTYIKDLTSHISIKRTTIYSIINRLHEKGYVVINPHYEGPKGAKMYAAISPELFINRIIILKRKELELLEKIKLEVINKLETIYLESLEFSLKEIDNFLKPYLKPLYDKGWKVLEHIVEKSQITNEFEAYDTTLLVPDAKVVKDAGFMVFKYNHDIEKDKNTLNYMFEMLSRKGKEEILNKGLGVEDVQLIENEFEINGRKFKGHLPEFRFENSNKFVKLTETIMIPIKNKIFFMWAENHEFILMMIDAVFKIEK